MCKRLRAAPFLIFFVLWILARYCVAGDRFPVCSSHLLMNGKSQRIGKRRKDDQNYGREPMRSQAVTSVVHSFGKDLYAVIGELQLF